MGEIDDATRRIVGQRENEVEFFEIADDFQTGALSEYLIDEWLDARGLDRKEVDYFLDAHAVTVLALWGRAMDEVDGDPEQALRALESLIKSVIGSAFQTGFEVAAYRYAAGRPGS